MTDSIVPPPVTAEVTPPVMPVVTPAPTPAQNTPAPMSAADGVKLLDAFNALPEKIVNSIREATQAATPPVPVKAVEPVVTPPPVKVAESQPNPPQTFAQWWFGR